MFLSEWREFPSAPCLAGGGEKKNLMMTARVSMLLKSRVSLTCFRACFLPGRAKDLSAPQYCTFFYFIAPIPVHLFQRLGSIWRFGFGLKIFLQQFMRQLSLFLTQFYQLCLLVFPDKQIDFYLVWIYVYSVATRSANHRQPLRNILQNFPNFSKFSLVLVLSPNWRVVISQFSHNLVTEIVPEIIGVRF